jgi:cytochrome c553
MDTYGGKTMTSNHIASLAISAFISLSASIGAGGIAHGADVTAATIADAQKSALHKMIETCGICHGVDGRSVSPAFPHLAGQTAQYIELQLRAFKDQSRADPDAQAFMWGMASQLNDAMISGLAKYFSALPPASAARPGNAVLISRGKRLFEEGVPGRQIPPCATCHGSHAEGTAVLPRLAGQHAPYLFKQMMAIQTTLRFAPAMHGVVKDLDKEQMQAVVAYLESI